MLHKSKRATIPLGAPTMKLASFRYRCLVPCLLTCLLTFSAFSSTDTYQPIELEILNQHNSTIIGQGSVVRTIDYQGSVRLFVGSGGSDGSNNGPGLRISIWDYNDNGFEHIQTIEDTRLSAVFDMAIMSEEGSDSHRLINSAYYGGITEVSFKNNSYELSHAYSAFNFQSKLLYPYGIDLLHSSTGATYLFITSIINRCTKDNKSFFATAVNDTLQFKSATCSLNSAVVKESCLELKGGLIQCFVVPGYYGRTLEVFNFENNTFTPITSFYNYDMYPAYNVKALKADADAIMVFVLSTDNRLFVFRLKPGQALEQIATVYDSDFRSNAYGLSVQAIGDIYRITVLTCTGSAVILYDYLPPCNALVRIGFKDHLTGSTHFTCGLSSVHYVDGNSTKEVLMIAGGDSLASIEIKKRNSISAAEACKNIAPEVENSPSPSSSSSSGSRNFISSLYVAFLVVTACAAGLN